MKFIPFLLAVLFVPMAYSADDCAYEPIQHEVPNLNEEDEAGFPKLRRDELPENVGITDILPYAEERGLIGLVHGNDLDTGVMVFTYHVPGEFFTRFNFSVYSLQVELHERLRGLKRGDRIYVRGEAVRNAGQPHIFVEDFALLKTWQVNVAHPGGVQTKTHDAHCLLAQNGRIDALVHAIVPKAKLLVLEFQDTVIPVVAPNRKAVGVLYRGDVIEVSVSKMEDPEHPKHYVVNKKEDGKLDLTVIERLVDRHQENVEITGSLVRFPRSPTINRTIWAIEDRIEGVGARYYTLVPAGFELEEFEKVHAKMIAHWDAHAATAMKGRNKYINPGAQITVTGTLNIVSQSQANVQVLTTADQITPQ